MDDFIVYHHYDKDDNLLYVGRTHRSEVRNREHEASADWFRQVVKTTYVHFNDYVKMVVAETESIKEGKPRHNKIHNPAATFKTFLGQQRTNLIAMNMSRDNRFPDTDNLKAVTMYCSLYSDYRFNDVLLTLWTSYRSMQRRLKKQEGKA